MTSTKKYGRKNTAEATAEIIADKLDKKANQALVDQSIKAIGQKLH